MVTKKRIDTGIRNNPSTGDVLNDGGLKINSVVDDIYNKFGDVSLYENNFGIDKQRIHATGYYQRHNRLYYAQMIELGSRHNIDTTLGPITIRLPKLKAGEFIEIVNPNGSLSSRNYLDVVCEATDAFMDGSKNKTFRAPNSKITLWGAKEDRGRGQWNYSVHNLYDEDYTPVDINTFIGTTTSTFFIANIEDYKVMKFLLYFHDPTKGLSKSSEVLLHINTVENKLYHTEYAVVGSQPDELFKFNFVLDDDEINFEIQSSIGGNARFMMKSIETM